MEQSHYELNPLENPRIVEHIFQFLTFQDLLSCRLVSRLWRQCSAKSMQKRSKVEINCSDDCSGLLQFVKDIRIENTSLAQFPFINTLNLTNSKSWKVLTRKNRTITSVQAFWELFGAKIKSLSMNGLLFKSPESFLTLVCRFCSNLESLTIKNCRICDSRKRNACIWKPPRFTSNLNLRNLYILQSSLPEDCLVYLIEQFPSLEFISLQGSPYIISPLMALTNLGQLNPKMCWALEFDFNEHPKYWEYLPYFQNSVLRFNKLIILNLNYPGSALELQEILSAQSDSLRHLCLSLPHLNIPSPLDFPVGKDMPLASIARLDLSIDNLSSFNFLSSFPNLKKLTLKKICHYVVLNTDLSSCFTSQNCTELEVEFKIRFINPVDFLGNFFSWFPNTRILKTSMKNARNKDFAVICRLLPKLTSLHILSSDIDDYGLSGLDVYDVDIINNRGETTVDRLWRPITVPRPNLSSLSRKEPVYDLVEFYWGRENPQINYCAAAYAIEKLPMLRRVRIFSHQTWNNLKIWDRLHRDFCWSYRQHQMRSEVNVMNIKCDYS